MAKNGNPKLKFLIVLGIILAVWFSFGYSQITDWISHNPILSFFLIWLVFDAALMLYVFHLNPISYPKVFLAFFIVGIAFDIIIPPYLVNQSGVITQDPTVITSDVIFYMLWGQTGAIGYYLTFVLTPLLLLALASIFLPTKDFFEQLRTSV